MTVRPPRVAIVKLSSLGDVIHALPVARAIRRARPDAHLTWIVEAREHALLKDHPDLDAVVTVDTRRWRRLIWRPAGMREVLGEVRRLRATLRAQALDVAIDLQGLIKSGLLTAGTGARVRIGFRAARCRERLNALFTNRRVLPPAGARHVVEQYLSLLAPLGIAPGAPEFHVPVPAAAERRMDELLAKEGVKRGDRLVAINPGAGRPEKRWPAASFRTVADRLATEAAARLLVLWGPSESHLAREIAVGLPGSGAVLAPPTDLGELTALLRRCRLMIAGDTGPLHLAAALGTPALGLFGPTSADRNGPYGGACRALQSPDGRMTGLDAETVFETARTMLEGVR
ncbi:MAG TPA: lipopolysaccharide heptosyltransferase I [Candidatus Bathyarchaeia archaeon]|nr:lipopolysaccharide heptosyltransferase I [Candidatus Bathyarchaeia archaeon]